MLIDWYFFLYPFLSLQVVVRFLLTGQLITNSCIAYEWFSKFTVIFLVTLGSHIAAWKHLILKVIIYFYITIVLLR